MFAVPKSGAEYAYLLETFGKQHKFWGPLPAFICNWVYVMVLRPAEVAILILICITYSIEPIGHNIGFNQLDPVYKQHFKKLLAISVLCNKIDFKLFHSSFFFFNFNRFSLPLQLLSHTSIYVALNCL